MILSEALANNGIKFSLNADTSEISSIKAGGIAKYIAFPNTAEQLIDTIRIAAAYGIHYKVIGKATNVFFSDSGFDGLIISTSRLCDLSILRDGFIVNAGISLAFLVREAAKRGFRLSPELSGIPGSIGGALRNNAGAYGKEISESFEFGEFYFTESDSVIILTADELNFSYRNSLLSKGTLVFIRGKIKAKAALTQDVFKEISYYTEQRRKKQPSEPSLGSFFKHAGEYYASKLIDDCGLKGFSLGGAEISKKHAGFIINTGNATAHDINRVAKFAEDTVYEKYGIKLIREAEFIE